MICSTLSSHFILKIIKYIKNSNFEVLDHFSCSVVQLMDDFIEVCVHLVDFVHDCIERAEHCNQIAICFVFLAFIREILHIVLLQTLALLIGLNKIINLVLVSKKMMIALKLVVDIMLHFLYILNGFEDILVGVLAVFL